MAYTFTQTGAEIQDILDDYNETASQVTTNTADIATNTENIATKVSKTGDTMTGALITQPTDSYTSFSMQRTDITKGTTPSSNVYMCINAFDSTGTTAVKNRIGHIEWSYTTAGKIYSRIGAYAPTSGSTTGAWLDVGVNADGTNYTYAPTPSTGDSSNNIATTSFVKINAGFYTSGDTITIKDSSVLMPGMITSSGKSVHFFFPCQIVNASSATLTTDANWQIWHADGGYIVNGATLTSSFSTVGLRPTASGIYFTCTLASASSLTNNCTIVARNNGNVVITLS